MTCKFLSPINSRLIHTIAYSSCPNSISNMNLHAHYLHPNHFHRVLSLSLNGNSNLVGQVRNLFFPIPHLLYHKSCWSDFHNIATWAPYHYFYSYHSDPRCQSLSYTSLLLLNKWCPCFCLHPYLFSTQEPKTSF